MRKGLAGKVIRKLDVVVRVEDRCAMGCIEPTSDDAGMEYIREIYTHPLPSQLQERLRVLCIFRSTGWGVRKITTGGIVGEMDLSPRPIVEAFSRAVDQSRALLTSLLRLPTVKAISFP